MQLCIARVVTWVTVTLLRISRGVKETYARGIQTTSNPATKLVQTAEDRQLIKGLIARWCEKIQQYYTENNKLHYHTIYINLK